MGENVDSGFLVDTEIDEGFSVDPYTVIYKVFAKLNEHNCIICVESTAFHGEDVYICKREGMSDGETIKLFYKPSQQAPHYFEEIMI